MNKENLVQNVINAQKGDKTAVENLYNEFHEKLYFFVLKNVKNKETAEDITADSFLKSIENIGKLKNPERYGSWLYRIAYNKCQDNFREISHNAYFDTDEEKENSIETSGLDEPVMLPNDYAENQEIRNQLKNIIENLKPDMRSAVILYYYNNFTISQVAKALNIKENAAKQKLFQARKKLKDRISQLIANGVVLSAVPMNKMIKNTVSPKYAAKISKPYISKIKSMKVTTKAVIAAAVSAAIIIPAGIALSSQNGIGEFNDKNSKNISAHNDITSSSDIDSDIEKALVKNSPAADSSIKTIDFDDSSKIETLDDTSSVSDSAVSTTKNNSSKSTKQTKKNKPTDNSSKSNNENKMSESERQKKISELTGEKLINMTVEEALALGNNKYQVKQATNVQSGYPYIYSCDDFPAYYFRSWVYTEEGNENIDRSNLPQNAIIENGFRLNYPKDKINEVNLYNGAYINDKIKVGMTYNELKEFVTAQEIGGIYQMQAYLMNSDLRLGAYITVGSNGNAHNWIISFDITDEQYETIYQRVVNKIRENGNMTEDLGPDLYTTAVDISDINPRSYVACYRLT